MSSIIEVGAVLVKDGKIKAEYQSFARYSGELSLTIKKLTGITERDLVGAKPIDEVIDELKRFCGKFPVVSHNGFAFDFVFLENAGFRPSEKYDSMELAFFALPTNEAGHSVSALSRKFSLSTERHRALDDSKLEFEVINKLRETISHWPKKRYSALREIAENTQWWWLNLLPTAPHAECGIADLVEEYEPYRKDNSSQDKLLLGTKAVNFSEIESHFTPTSAAGDYNEDRPEQREMAATVLESFNQNRHLTIEAGTGTGKSKAYLVPALAFAIQNDLPVIVSTHTKALQDQLYTKEIPHLAKLFGRDPKIAMLKGKKNYVCLHKLEEFLDDVIYNQQQRSLYESGMDGVRFTSRLGAVLISSWVVETSRGDWDEIPYWLKERLPKRVEQDICNSDELCTKEICSYHKIGKCFLAKARLRAKDADLIVANHAIVLSGIIPAEQNDGDNLRPSHVLFPNEAKFLIIDEAHHLEENATSAWTMGICNDDLDKVFERVYGKRGIANLAGRAVTSGDPARLNQCLKSLADSEKDFKLMVQSLFKEFLPKMFAGEKDSQWTRYLTFGRLRVSQASSYAAFTELLRDLSEKLSSVSSIISAITDFIESDIEKSIMEHRVSDITNIIRSIGAALDDGEGCVRYLQCDNNFVSIQVAPILVAESLKNLVYDNFSSVILTSATLTVNKSFAFFAERCGIELVDPSKMMYKLLKSCFDYEKQVKFFVDKDLEYSSAESSKHLNQAASFMEKAIISSNGGALVLCSSHTQVDYLFKTLYEPLARNNLLLLRQNKGSSVNSTIRDFREDLNSSLIGTEVLWQGIDVPGDSLRILFIIKIPYRAPGIPIIEARKEYIDSYGGNGFGEYCEPLAALAIKQGFGRLIRKVTDKGAVVFLDRRIMKKPLLYKSLPDGVSPHLTDEGIILNEIHAQELLRNATSVVE